MTITFAPVSPAERRAIWQVRLTALAVFGPYVTGSARTEQIIILAILTWVLVTGWPRLVNASHGPFPFLVIWGAVYTVMLTSTVWRPSDPLFYGALAESNSLAAMAGAVGADVSSLATGCQP